MPSNNAAGDSTAVDPSLRQGDRPVRTRQRRVSRTRQTFLRAIDAQIAGTRLLAFVALAVLLAGGFLWLRGTTGSPVIGVYFVVLALVLGVTVSLFIQVMHMFIGKR